MEIILTLLKIWVFFLGRGAGAGQDSHQSQRQRPLLSLDWENGDVDLGQVLAVNDKIGHL